MGAGVGTFVEMSAEVAVKMCFTREVGKADGADL